MSFKNHSTKQIEIGYSDSEWIYLKKPERIRVNRKTHSFEKLVGGNYVDATFTFMGTKKYKYPALSINTILWSVPRILATLFVPNPNNYRFVYAKDPFDTDTMKWVNSPCQTEKFDKITKLRDREESLTGIPSHTLEYFRAYNAIKGADGLTNTQRYVARKRSMGLVLLKKRMSPIGHQVWITPELKSKIVEAMNNGTINNPAVKAKLIEEIETMPRKNKMYKSFQEELCK